MIKIDKTTERTEFVIGKDFLNDINQNDKIANANNKPYKISKTTKKEIEEGIKHQIRFYNSRIATLKRQLKQLKK